jgi:hypothetical protein
MLNRVAVHQELRQALGFASRNAFDRTTGELVKLRNHLAHGRSILSMASRPCQAVECIQRLEGLMDQVRELLNDREQLWNAFAATEIVANTDSYQVWAGHGAGALPIPAPVHVITAQNPHEQVLGELTNANRHGLLALYLQLHCPNAPRQEVVGRSSTGPWKETSWAISGLERDDAMRIAARFQQRAIFELTDQEVLVIGVDGQLRRRIDRLR